MPFFRKITSSLRAKLLTMFVILTSIPLIAVGLVSYQKSFDTVSGHSKAATMLVADRLALDIDVLFQDTGRLLELEKNPQVLRFLFSQSETYEDAKFILKTFDLYRQTYKYESVLNMTMINLYGRGISERKGVFQLDYNPLRNPHFAQLMSEPNEVLNIPPTKSSDWDRLDGFRYPDRNVITIMATVKQQITHEVVGFIVIDLDDSVVERFSSNVKIGKTGLFYVADDKGVPIFTPSAPAESESPFRPVNLSERAGMPRDSFVDSTANPSQFVVFATSQATGWKIVGSAPLEEIVEDANRIRQLIIVSVVLSIVFTITLYFFITSRLTRPIQLLKSKMRQAASGYLDAKVKPSGQDEIADLGTSFNTMIEKIKMLLEQSIREQEHIQKAELRTLQAQINPHFLYNTLDSIVWMAEAGKNEQVIQLVQALSRFFRISLNKGRDWISIKIELDHVQNYLIIQKMRYRDILDYEVNVSPELQVYPILKMTLQPLVENALYHGIKNKRGKGLIRIGAYVDQVQDIVLFVEDNGIGMNSERLDAVRAQLDQPREMLPDEADIEDGKNGGFGLQNVHQRLRLYFGERYGLRIDSEEHKGTCIYVRIPKK
ncbi:sensor histidine kinase [Cohnella cholangitidis]|uniref:HAMP domain-containing protein n=1 Tax=Cohnella cholangitidis TaxID=2598458 RepID=A0A7G5C1V3_9BACL|nr:sensor histidine kinase [Cohnella cholangitidis]QMV43187.1 HAMP domain-containing protein [Cohnella cholangitidis]